MPDLKCDVLKMPHHGAFYDGKNGMGLNKILEVLNPKDVIISSGDIKNINILKNEHLKFI